jgi:hypothetical protein
MLYKIKQYSYDQASRLDVTIKPSSKANYKIDVFNKSDDKYITSVGDKRYSDFPSYAELNGIEYANKRRALYHARHMRNKRILCKKYIMVN